MAATFIETADLRDGILAASAAGRAKIASNFFDEATVSDKFANVSISPGKLKTGGQTFDFTGSAAVLAPDPTTNAQDVITLGYYQRNDWKQSVKAATTANLAATNNGSGVLTADANGVLAAQDGVSVTVNDRILLKDQSTAADNGIYVVTDVGTGGTPYILTRATDANSSAKVTAGLTVFVSQGTSHGNRTFQLSTDDAITLNTTGLTFFDMVNAAAFSGDLNSTSLGYLTDTSGDLRLIGNASSNIVAKLGDAAGARSFQVTDSTDAVQFTVTSDGAATLASGLTVTTGNIGVSSGNITASGDITGGNIATASGGVFTSATNSDVILQAAGTGVVQVNESSFYVGTGGAGNITIFADQGGGSLPALRFNDTTDRWQFTNDGTTYYNIETTPLTALDGKDSVRVATTANLAATRSGNVLTATANGSINGTGIDGVTDLALDDRILVKNQSTTADNGLYYVTAVGDGSNPYTLTRTTDADASSEVTAGLYVFVTEGTTNGDTGWVLTTNDPITLNTTGLAFAQFSTGLTVTGLAGAGLVANGSALDVNVDNSTLEIVGDVVRMKDAGTTFAKLATAVSDRLGGYDRREDFVGDGSTVNFDLAVNDAKQTGAGIIVVSSGLTRRPGATEDYQLSDNGGTGGVDRITFNTAPANGANISIFYKRTGSAI